MTTRDLPAALPDEVALLLASGDEEAAGETLLEHAERLARTEPRQALAWSRAVVEEHCESSLFGAFVSWSAGVIHHLTGEPDRPPVRRFGHSMIAGTRMPPSHRVAFLPRNGPAELKLWM